KQGKRDRETHSIRKLLSKNPVVQKRYNRSPSFIRIERATGRKQSGIQEVDRYRNRSSRSSRKHLYWSNSPRRWGRRARTGRVRPNVLGSARKSHPHGWTWPV